MCLGIPGKVVETYREHDVLMGKVDFGGVFKRVCLEHVPEVQIGAYVIVHVGFALNTIDETEARTRLRISGEDEPTRRTHRCRRHEISRRISRHRGRPQTYRGHRAAP